MSRWQRRGTCRCHRHESTDGDAVVRGGTGWLDQATPKERAEQMTLVQGEPTEAIEWFKVSKDVGNVLDQRAPLIQPVG